MQVGIMFSLAVGVQDAASLHAGNLLGIRALLVLFRIIVRAVMKVVAQNQDCYKNRHRSFYAKGGAISYCWV